MSQPARRLSRDARDVDVILPFEEVVDALGRVEERYVGLQTIDLDSILGTADRGAPRRAARPFPAPRPPGPPGRLRPPGPARPRRGWAPAGSGSPPPGAGGSRCRRSPSTGS